MKLYQFDDKFFFDCCPHLEWNKDNGFNLLTYDEMLPLGFDKDGNQYLLVLCLACGERIERKMFINMVGNFGITVQWSANKIELKSKNLWKKFINLLRVDDFNVK